MRLYIKLRTLDNLIIREKHSTQFEANILDYIPGSTILGELANTIYGSLPEEQALRIFQKNQTIFSNCYPLVSSAANEQCSTKLLSLPVPLCLHVEKGNKNSIVYNFLVQNTNDSNSNKSNNEEEKVVQYKQLRDKYITPDFKTHSVKVNSTARTSINDTTETAKDSTLYNCSYISKNSYFAGYIDGLDEDIKLIKEVISKNSCIHLGKCRTAEFGRAEISIISDEEAAKFSNLYTPGKNCVRDLFLWCVSDCEFYDISRGISSVIPQVSNLWLENSDGFEFDYTRSFIRTRTVRLFNRKRNGQDGEKQLVKKGSVICIKLNRDLSSDELNKIAKKGIGLGTHLGYGQVIVNPLWVDVKEIKDIEAFTEVKLDNSMWNGVGLSNVTNRRTKGLKELLNLRRGFTESQLSASSVADSKFKDVAKMYFEARKYNGAAKTSSYGPTKTQWGNLRASIINLRSTEDEQSVIMCMDVKNDKFVSTGCSFYRDVIFNELCPKSDKEGWSVVGEYTSVIPDLKVPSIYSFDYRTVSLKNDNNNNVMSCEHYENGKVITKMSDKHNYCQVFAEAFIGLIYKMKLVDMICLFDKLMHQDLSDYQNLELALKKGDRK